MYLTKCSVNLASTAAATTAYSSEVVNGAVYAVLYNPTTASLVPSTATLTVSAETTSLIYLNAITATTDEWIKYPRAIAVDSTGANIGSTSDNNYPIVAPYIHNSRIKVVIAGGTSASQTGTLDVFVEGGNA